MKQNPKRIQLDRNKLLGFKFAQSAQAKNDGKYSQARLGAKLGAKLGSKTGAKVGVRLA